MKKQDRASQSRRELDRRLERLDLDALRSRPHRGWVRAVRSALGMSQDALAARMGVSHTAIAHLESAELAGGVTLTTLGRVAAALDCTLVYALVPNTTLEDTLLREARRGAAERRGYVSSTMALEAQGIDERRRGDQLEAIAREMVANGTVWAAGRRPAPPR